MKKWQETQYPEIVATTTINKDHKWIKIGQQLINLDRIFAIISTIDRHDDNCLHFETCNDMYSEVGHCNNNIFIYPIKNQTFNQLIDELNVQLEKFGIPTLNYVEDEENKNEQD